MKNRTVQIIKKTSLQILCLVILITSLLADFCLSSFAQAQEQDPAAKYGSIHIQNKSPFRTIYGEDDRQDIFEVSSASVRELARSVGAFIYYKKISEVKSSNEFSLELKSYADRYKMCKGVRYAEQASAPFATGFLVAPNIVATAAHVAANSKKEVIIEEALCSETYFIFDYALTTADQDLKKISSSAVYKCKRVIERKLAWMQADYALIELDRPVTDRQFLRFSKNGLPKVNDKIFTLGYPHGLPLKYSGVAQVRGLEEKDSRFSSNSDLTAGNSGSPVFDATTNEVLGIHVSGEYDLTKKNGCYVPYVCKDNDCWGSWAYRPDNSVLERIDQLRGNNL